MLPINVRIASARYANPRNTLVFALLTDGNTWFVRPNDGSGQANVLAQWVQDGGNIGPYVPPVPGGTVPTGSILWYASPQTPVNYLLCDGRAVKRRQYEKLFRVIGTTFGAGDGGTTFNLPDLRGRMVRGWGPENPLDIGREFGTSQGDMMITHRHSITDPGHTHVVLDPGHLHGVNDPGHTHIGDDPGHNHPVPNPGLHYHNKTFLSTGYGVGIIPAVYISISEGITYESFSPQGLMYNGSSRKASANLTVTAASANLQTGVGEADVSDKINFTGITVNNATTNINETEIEGGPKVQPPNLALVPYIRY